MRTRILLLVLLTGLPVLFLFVAEDLEERWSAARRVQDDMRRLISLAASQQERFVEGTRGLLVALAHLPAVRNRGGEACNALFSDFLEHYPFYANLGAADQQGNVFCSALRLNRPVSLADRTWFRGAVQSRELAAGDYQIDRIAGRATVEFGFPVLDEAGAVQGVVFVGLDLRWLWDMAAEARLAPGSTLTLFDVDGTVLVHYPDARTPPGTEAAQTPLFQAIVAQPREATLEAADLDGIPSLFAVAPLGGGAVFLAIGTPKSLALAEANRRFILDLTALGAVALLAVVAAWWFGGRFILRPVRTLLDATERLQGGDLGARTRLPPGHGELNQLALGFDRMAERLQEREEQLGRSLAQTTELKNLLDNVFSSIVSGVMVTDLHGNIALCNLAALTILGRRDPGELVGQNVAELLPPVGAMLLPHLLATGQTGKPVLGLEMNPILPPRGAVHLRFNISALKRTDHRQGIAIVLDDVTEKRRMEAQQRLMECMISPAVLRQIDPEHLELGGKRTEITTLFADIHGFTGLGDQLKAEDLVGLLNQYLAAMANAVLDEEGTIDKFLGDAVMAWFNAPLPQPDHALRATRAALRLREAVHALHQELSPIFRLSIGVGLHVGEAVLGLVGTQTRLEYTAIGDAVNTAKRIQEHSGQGQILISAAMYTLVRDQALVGPATWIQVKGKQKPLEVHELIGLK